jgi:SET domain-containing protein
VSGSGTLAAISTIAGTMPDPVSPIKRAALRVDRSPLHGAGVFAAKDFEPDQVIERCPLLIVPPEQADCIADSVFGDYVYEWEEGYALALGYGSLYNHSHTPSARYEMDYELEEIHVVARRRIKRGEEILISYNGDADDQAPVWFEEGG